jgi:hypothetical protein
MNSSSNACDSMNETLKHFKGTIYLTDGLKTAFPFVC